MSLLPVDDALARILDGVAPLDAQSVEVAQAAGASWPKTFKRV